MYERAEFEETRLDVLHGLIRSYPFAVFVTSVEGEIDVNHVPFLLETTAGELGTLKGHVARANNVWQNIPEQTDSVVVFRGPHAYISPSWYPGKQEHGRVVPTWNYAVVHAHGRPRIIEDTAWLRGHLSELTEMHEAGRVNPWKLTDAPEDYTDRMLRGIVGLEMPITRIKGKWKVSQNRSREDRFGVIAGLESRGDPQSLAVAELVRQYLDGADTAD